MVVKYRHAFTLIELLFAIVVIATAVLSLPMMTEVASLGVASNLETQEAVRKATLLTKTAITESDFATIDAMAQIMPTDIAETTGLQNYKFHQQYSLSIQTGATFGTKSSSDIKKITTKVYSKSGKLLATLVAYKFNY